MLPWNKLTLMKQVRNKLQSPLKEEGTRYSSQAFQRKIKERM